MKLTKQRVVVTGGAGFIGSHVVDRLVEQDNTVVVIDDLSTGSRDNLAQHADDPRVTLHVADVRDEATMERLVDGADAVVHLAVACLRRSLTDPVEVHEINAGGTLAVCQAALRADVQRLVYVSSSEVYGSAVYAPMDENHPLRPTTVYGGSKAAGEHYAFAHLHTYGLPVTVVRPFNTYGPREHAEGTSAEVIPKFVLRVLAGLPPVVFGDGQQTRDFTWVVDTARGIVAAAEDEKLVGECVNIARGQEVTIAEVSRLVLEKLDRTDLVPAFEPSGRPGDVRRHVADVARAADWLGFVSTVDLDQGLDLYIAWVRDQDVDLNVWRDQERVRNW